MAQFPAAVWDGREPSRPVGAHRPPSPNDWAEIVQELRAVQAAILTTVAGLEQDAIAALTDETTGTPDGTLELVGDTSTDESTNINKNFAELNAKVDAIIAALVAANILTEEA